ncbi:MAG: TolC family protein [Robiginitomaculum sp.]|nr:TolC family protein [Robiginitomaculum sp.]
MSKIPYILLLPICAVLLLSGCANMQSLSLTSKPSDESVGFSAPDKWVANQDVDTQIADDWAGVFDDSEMFAIIEEALKNNPSLRSSAQNVARSQAALRQSRSSFFPRLDIFGAMNSTTPLENTAFTERYSAGLNASWEVDLWGRIRSGVRASEFNLAASEAFYRNAREALIAQTARSYIAIIEAQKQLELNDETVSALNETLRIVRLRHNLGSASRREVVLAESDLANSRDRQETASSIVRSTVRSLEVLLGRYPTASLELPNTFPPMQQSVAIGQPADILRRRPDILAAENNLASAFSTLSIESNSRWPRLTISSDLSSSALDPDKLFDPASLALSFGLRLADNLFDGGLTKGRIEAAEANSRQALADYGQIVLNAFLEVENQLDNLSVLGRRHEFTKLSAAAASETLYLAEIQYKEGAIDLLDVLTFRQRSFQADRNLLVIERLRFEAKINLYLALGGSGLKIEADK